MQAFLAGNPILRYVLDTLGGNSISFENEIVHSVFPRHCKRCGWANHQISDSISIITKPRRPPGISVRGSMDASALRTIYLMSAECLGNADILFPRISILPVRSVGNMPLKNTIIFVTDDTWKGWTRKTGLCAKGRFLDVRNHVTAWGESPYFLTHKYRLRIALEHKDDNLTLLTTPNRGRLVVLPTQFARVKVINI